jgi:hypothetical protein
LIKVYFLHCFIQYVLAPVVNHLQAHYFS